MAPPRADNVTPVAPTGPNPAVAAPATVAANVGASSSSSKSSGSGGSGGGSNPYAAAEARALARENAAKRKAGRRYIEQAKTLEAQAQALQLALRKTFKNHLRQNLKDVGDVLRDQQAILLEGYNTRVGSLEGSAEDNEKALGDTTAANTLNMAREAGMTLSEVAMQGAGESDLLASMMMSLENWSANQGEANRSYSDTLRSINASLSDLGVDTKTAMANNEIAANEQREQLWQGFRDRRSESFTQLGNIRGQQADYYAMAKEMGVGGGGGGGGRSKASASAKSGSKKGNGGEPRLKFYDPDSKAPLPGGPGAGRPGLNSRPIAGANVKEPSAYGLEDEQRKFRDLPKGGRKKKDGNGPAARNLRQSRRLMRRSFMQASREAGKSWDNPGVSDATMNWEGREQFEATAPVDAPGVAARKRPEGASLRKW